MAVEQWLPIVGFEGAATNLEWVTRVENMRHAAKHGLLATGDRHGRRTQPEAFHGRY